jgi:hypothetical protein
MHFGHVLLNLILAYVLNECSVLMHEQVARSCDTGDFGELVLVGYIINLIFV